MWVRASRRGLGIWLRSWPLHQMGADLLIDGGPSLRHQPDASLQIELLDVLDDAAGHPGLAAAVHQVRLVQGGQGQDGDGGASVPIFVRICAEGDVQAVQVATASLSSRI